ncbi:MAG: hypothetical protein C0417_11005 [Chlorobiaceae bacterium]|nr:hypothetical protein [Chlorobiaceae bacterium]
MKRYHKIGILLLVIVVVVAFFLQIINAKEGSSLPPKHSHLISLKDGSRMTHAFREQAGPDAIKGSLFWKEYIQKLLDQPDCVAMRYYYAIEDGKNTLVLVGVNSDGNDITNGTILEVGLPCPPFCSTQNPLTSNIEVAVGN